MWNLQKVTVTFRLQLWKNCCCREKNTFCVSVFLFENSHLSGEFQDLLALEKQFPFASFQKHMKVNEKITILYSCLKNILFAEVFFSNNSDTEKSFSLGTLTSDKKTKSKVDLSIIIHAFTAAAETCKRC